MGDNEQDAGVYVTQGQKFGKPFAASRALDRLLEDVQEGIEDRSAELEKTRKFLADCAGLRDVVRTSLDELMPGWKEKGVPGSTVLMSEKRTDADYGVTVEFTHPPYEKLWLTDAKDQPVTPSFAFMSYFVGLGRDGDVNVYSTDLETNINLPTLTGSYDLVRVGLEALRKENTVVENVQGAAYAARDRLTAAVKQYCADHELGFSDGTKKAEAAPAAQSAASAPKASKGMLPPPAAPAAVGKRSGDGKGKDDDPDWSDVSDGK